MAELADDPGIGDPGPHPQHPVLTPPVPELLDPGEVEEGAGAEAVEVQLDHDVGATGDGDGLGVRSLGRQRISP